MWYLLISASFLSPSRGQAAGLTAVPGWVGAVPPVLGAAADEAGYQAADNAPLSFHIRRRHGGLRNCC